jgi:nucleotide-binding universal stress UspA family protein
VYRTILVPLDGSLSAEAAVPFARAIAERARAELQFVLVHHSSVPGGIPDGFTAYAEATRKAEQGYLSQASGRLVPGSVIATTTTMLEGPVAEAISKHVLDTRPDLIVMSTHGRGAFNRFWMGSVADRLVRSLPIPMVLIRSDPDETSAGPAPVPARIAVALDRSGFGEAVLGPAGDLAALFEAELVLVHVVHPPLPIAEPPLPYVVGYDEVIAKELASQAETYLGALAGTLRERGLAVTTRVAPGGDTATTILGLVEESEAGMVAIASHGESGVRRFLLGSVADKVLRGATVPVLICRPSSED